jgi:hypothetical protein
MVQAPTRPPAPEQYFIHSAITWEEFKTIQNVLVPQGVRVSYCAGEVELLPHQTYMG